METKEEKTHEESTSDTNEPSKDEEQPPPLAGANVMNVILVAAECAPFSKTAIGLRRQAVSPVWRCDYGTKSIGGDIMLMIPPLEEEEFVSMENGLILGALFLQPSFLVRENRYSASRGAHLNLKRAEKARVLVSKIPVMVDTLVAKTRAWEEEHNMSFAYDGVPLLAMLDDYGMLRQEREDEKRRLREQKKVQEQPHAEQDTVFSTRPSPARPVSAKKPVGHELATEEPMEHQTGVCL
ncbi:hypothetical protein Bca4012_091350 [Brassica carinata]